jgi:hypothetical protein
VAFVFLSFPFFKIKGEHGPTRTLGRSSYVVRARICQCDKEPTQWQGASRLVNRATEANLCDTIKMNNVEWLIWSIISIWILMAAVGMVYFFLKRKR